MTAKIYLLEGDNELRPMSEHEYATEDLLQTLLQKYPDLLAGDLMTPSQPRKWLLVSREMGVPDHDGGGDRWALDHLFLDHEAVPTLVEVKRASDTRTRREVVAQMLDYAANAVAFWPVEDLRSRFERECEKDGKSPEEMISTLLEQPEEDAVEDFWQQVKTNLQAGRLRLVFVADAIPKELQRIVEFLNEQMDPAEVLAVEVKQYVGEGLQALVPRLVGSTAAAERKKGRELRQWDEASFFTELRSQEGEEAVALARTIIGWIEPLVSRVFYGKGKKWASIGTVIVTDDGDSRTKYYPLFLWSYATIEIPFQWFVGKPGFKTEKAKEELLERFNAIPGFSLTKESLQKRPNIPISKVGNPEAMARLQQAIEWVVSQIRGAEHHNPG